MDTQFEVSTNTETVTLSLRQLHEQLDARGIKISYTSLSELISAGDIADQLGVSGGGNRKAFPAVAVEVLAAFLPEFRSAKGKTPQAASMLKAFLRSASLSTDSQVSVFRPTAEATEISPIAVAEAQGKAQGIYSQDRVMTAAEAAEYLRVSTRMLRRSVHPWKRYGTASSGDRWRLSQLIAD